MMTGILPSTFVRTLEVNGKEILKDSQGYILNLDEWSEDFVRALAKKEGLALTEEHWDVVRFLCDFFSRGGPQKQGNRLAGLLRTNGEHWFRAKDSHVGK
jgi:tRNA 2-thiouridine synthesizing protein E